MRRSGTRHLLQALGGFLDRGGTTRFAVGVDIENTSREGLQDLLSLDGRGHSETFIYHNEATSTFHPKLYLFSNANHARLIVGSNNITEAGLFSNTEAGLEIDARSTDQIIADAKGAIAAWCDPESPFVRRLDATLLNDLERLGYVLSETALQTRRRRNEVESRQRRPGRGRRLFQGQSVTVPRPPTTTTSVPGMVGRVLLMRVRRASETARRTQIQLPKRVVQTLFFDRVTALKSAHDGRSHGIHEAAARGGVNTLKVEIPEIDPVADPVLRLERSSVAITYQAFDASSILGRPIMDALERGRTMTPPATQLTRPSTPNRSTWWRFV